MGGTSKQFRCGVYTGYATNNNPKVAFTTNSKETSLITLGLLGIPIGALVDDTCSGTLPAGSTLPPVTERLNEANCQTFFVDNGGLLGLNGLALLPSTGTSVVRPDGTYTGTCHVTIGVG
ncbi:MAG: hypothetical protein ACR2IP_13935 [Solirubrobacteraceae bacterium]